MNEPRYCSQCGAELAGDVANELCPACIAKSNSEGRPKQNLAETSPWGSRFAAPKPEELARRFPQLEIIELIGQGGMGAVYKARQPTLDRLVAVKILPAEVAADPAFAERFTREARALARLNHPNIVGIYDFGQADSLYYFVMEYVDGVSLRQLAGEREITPRQALALVPQMCEALQFAHDEGIVHRDIKPENILVDKRGRVKVADFGLAKLLGRSADEATLTRVEQVMGTPLYMAPEQMQGSHAVDHRADIYSLGVVFYEMLTGELPMGRFAPPSQKVEVDVRLDEVVLRALEREPDRRYQHASDVKTDVESIAMGPARVAAMPPHGSVTISCPAPLRSAAIAMLFLGFLGCTSPISVLFSFGAAPHMVRRSEILLTLAIPIFLAAGAAATLAGWGMLRCRWYVFAAVVSALAFLSGFAGNVFGLLIGSWSLLVLSRADVQAAFSPAQRARQAVLSTTSHRDDAARQVRTASNLLFVLAAMSLIMALAEAALLILWRNEIIQFWSGSYSLLGMPLALILHCLILASAATAIRQLRALPYALLAIVAAGVFFPVLGVAAVIMQMPGIAAWPFIPLWLETPAILWAIVNLLPQVRQIFARGR
ncbi:MAG: protein kinase domain-containing protein [Pirellulales bacterium]